MARPLRKPHFSTGSRLAKTFRDAMRATPPNAPARAVQRMACFQLTMGTAGLRGGWRPVHRVKPAAARRRVLRSARAGSAKANALSKYRLVSGFIVEEGLGSVMGHLLQVRLGRTSNDSAGRLET